MMRPQTQELKQEIERQTSKLRERLYPFSKHSEASDILSTVVIVLLVVAALYIASNAVDSYIHIAVLLCIVVVLLTLLACIWINRLWLTDSTDREREKNLSARELITRFEEKATDHINWAIRMIIGLLCWSVSILIGIFEFHAILFIVWCLSIATSFFSYWYYLRSEKMARLLVEQVSD